jgi:predicted permease
MSWLSRLFRKSREEKRLHSELHFHLEQQVAAYVAAGSSEAEAYRRARMEFGGLEQVKEDCREARKGSLLETSMQDARFGVRMLRKNPGFTAVAALTLALGIGASTAVFSLVNAILLKPLPYPEANRIVMPWLVSPPGVNIGSEFFPWGQKQFRLVTREQHSFQAFGAFQNDSFNITGAGEPFFVDGFRASADFFTALGVSPAIGRTYRAEEDQPGREYEVVLSHTLWRERFGGDPGILGRAIRLNGYTYTVIGVMPPDFVFPRAEEMPSSFNFPRDAQLWVPLAVPAEPKGGPSELAVVARLKPRITMQQAQAEMDVIGKHAEAQDPAWKGWFNTRLTPLVQQVVGDTRRPLLLILGAVGVVLLIACSNVANLLLARSLARTKEFTLRTALGAGRGRLVRQLLTESLLLALSGGMAGVLLGKAGIYFVRTLGPSSIPRLHEATLDLRVVAFTFGVTLLSSMLFGLAPAIGATRENLAESLKERGSRSGDSSASPRIRNGLLVSEVALALVLVISAGLLVRTFFRLLATDAGFNPERVLTFQLSLPSVQYSDQDHIIALFRGVLDRLRAIPGVESAGIGETVPMSGEGESTVIRFSDQPPADPKEIPFANYTMISPGYLSAVGTPLLRGRDLQETDSANSLAVALVSEAMAKKYWPGEDALGKQIGPGSKRFPLETIVGIVADVRHTSLREEIVPEMYVPYNQKVWPSMLNMRVAIRSKSDPAALTESVREAIHSVDPELPLAKVATLTALVDNSMRQPRFAMFVLGAFGVLAMLLASIGMYGVISYSVSQRTQEIGIRMALGASRRSVFGMILGQGARLAALGIAIGFVAALAATRLMIGFLYGVQPTDPLTFAGVSLLLMAIALLACYVPAHRATRVDPMISLRYE